MAYVMGEQSRPQRPRRWPWVLAAAVVLVVVIVAGFLAGRSSAPAPKATPETGTASSSAAPPPPPQDPGGLGPVSWQPLAHGEQAPHSDEHGPRTVEGPLATGYSHDAGGAVMAALNLSMRLNGRADPNTAIRVLAAQTVGDRAEQALQLGAGSSNASPEETRPQRWWWAITGGAADGASVEVSLIVETEQTRRMGGYAQIRRTLAWHEGDWALRVPVTRPQVVPTVPAGHHLLEGPG